MSGKNKLKKFEDLATFANVFENHEFVRFDQIPESPSKHQNYGQWNGLVFENSNPICLELACGKGEYTIQLAERYADQNYIGVDIKGNRIWKGAKYALDNQLSNVCFLRTRIELLEMYFASREIQEIWITFPDPFLRKSRIKNRLTSHRFLNIYTQILDPSGIIHLKTDNTILYDFSLDSISSHPSFKVVSHSDDIYGDSELLHPDLDIKTFYEKQHLQKGLKIKYISFCRMA